MVVGRLVDERRGEKAVLNVVRRCCIRGRGREMGVEVWGGLKEEGAFDIDDFLPKECGRLQGFEFEGSEGFLVDFFCVGGGMAE